MHKPEEALLHDVYRRISEALGMEAARELYRLFAGQQIAFPVRLYSAEAVRRRIRQEYDGRNVRQLAEKYGYSERTVRRILRGR